jgi:hypothetical protein
MCAAWADSRPFASNTVWLSYADASPSPGIAALMPHVFFVT